MLAESEAVEERSNVRFQPRAAQSIVVFQQQFLLVQRGRQSLFILVHGRCYQAGLDRGQASFDIQQLRRSTADGLVYRVPFGKFDRLG